MKGTSIDPARRIRTIAALVLAAVLPWATLAADDAVAKRAVELYDAAQYTEARKLLEELDAAGEANGALLYRLYYCQRATGDGALGNETLPRAVERLEQEMNEGAGLETGFYLATGYENIGQRDKARDVATTILSRVEAGEIEAKTGVDQFRLGKLYADQGNEIEAANRYRSAILAFEEEGSGNSAYIVWASRYLADQALSMADYSAAEMYLTTLVEHSSPTVEDLDRLAVARVRNEMYREAAKAWTQAVPLGPAQSNRSRYCARLATMASRMKGLAETAPGDRAWDDMTREEIEELLKAQAGVVREIKVEYARIEELSDERLTEMQQKLHDTKRMFVTAGLEFALHGYDIREAAFLGGYAPLVFQSHEWKLNPGNKKKNQAGKRREKHEQRMGELIPESKSVAEEEDE